MRFVRRTVDVAAFLQDFHGRVDAAYFNNLRIMNVTSATVYGHNVRASGEFEHCAGQGNLPAVSFQFEMDGVPRRVMVTEDGLVMFQLDNDPAALALADAVNAALDKYASYDDVLPLGDGDVANGELVEGGDLVGDDL
jgi:hypothetical protein